MNHTFSSDIIPANPLPHKTLITNSLTDELVERAGPIRVSHTFAALHPFRCGSHISTVGSFLMDHVLLNTMCTSAA